MCAEMAHVLRRERFNSQESEETQTAVHDRRVLRAGRGQRLRFHALRVSCAHTVAQQADALYLSHSAMQAEAGCFDDCVMALALANHVHTGAWTPVESNDSFYIEMV